VEADNTGARELYARMGFGPHHAYHHYRWASSPVTDAGPDTGTADAPAGTAPAAGGTADSVSGDAGPGAEPYRST
jgi:hypothetical protein